jgi:hypothetical protein
MRRSVLLVGLAALVAGVTSLGGASGAARLASASTVRFGGPIAELKADSGRAIVVVNPDPDCSEVVVWSPTTDDRVRLAGCTNSGVALAGDRAAWLLIAKGNGLETYVYMVSLASGRSPHVKPTGWLAWTRAHQQGWSGPRMANLYGDSGLLAYNFYEICQPDDPDFPPDVPCPAGYAAGATSREQIRLVLPADG